MLTDFATMKGVRNSSTTPRQHREGPAHTSGPLVRYLISLLSSGYLRLNMTPISGAQSVAFEVSPKALFNFKNADSEKCH